MGECLKIHLGAEFTTVVKRYENLGYQAQGCFRLVACGAQEDALGA